MDSLIIENNNRCTVQLWARGAVSANRITGRANLQDDSADDMPGFVTAQFRVLSKTLLKERGLDFTYKNTLKESTQLLLGKTVYPNHHYWNIDNALGSVSSVWWDQGGDGKPPGINAEIKIDAWENRRIARGLKMKPPAINSISATVVFEFEPSHPELVEEKRFWGLLGEEIDGEVVRLIATKIVDFIEISLVYRGEDPHAVQLSKQFFRNNNNSREVVSVKLTEKQQKLLSLSSEATEQQLLERAVALAESQLSAQEIAVLSTKAAEADKILAAKREEVKSLALTVEFGSEEGELNPILAKAIDGAGGDELVSLEDSYRNRLRSKLPSNGRSSQPAKQPAAEAAPISESTLL